MLVSSCGVINEMPTFWDRHGTSWVHIFSFPRGWCGKQVSKKCWKKRMSCRLKRGTRCCGFFFHLLVSEGFFPEQSSIHDDGGSAYLVYDPGSRWVFAVQPPFYTVVARRLGLLALCL